MKQQSKRREIVTMKIFCNCTKEKEKKRCADFSLFRLHNDMYLVRQLKQ